METREFFRRELLLAPFPPAHLLHSIQPLSTDLRVLPRPRACIRLLLNLVLCHLLFDLLSVNKPFAQFQLGAFSHLQFFSTLFVTLCSAFSLPPYPFHSAPSLFLSCFVPHPPPTPSSFHLLVCWREIHRLAQNPTTGSRHPCVISTRH